LCPPQIFHETKPDYVIITAWKFEDEIVAKEQDYLKIGGCFIIPLLGICIEGEV
jgi:hypothetical protein